MDRYRTYDGRRHAARRRQSSARHSPAKKKERWSVKLLVCLALFVIVGLVKLVFPSAITELGNKLNSVVNYKAALTALGEGISGEKKFITALGEAFTYAFTGESENNADGTDAETGAPTSETNASDSNQVEPNAAAAAISPGEIETDSSQTGSATDTASAGGTSGESTSGNDASAASSASNSSQSFSDAVVAAFMESQETYSDYEIPAGVTYTMPNITIDHATPVVGVVSSPFGYRLHPTDNVVKFHYGIDFEAKEGTAITAFADGKVIAVGESTTLGKYVLIRHGEVESEYAHCSKTFVTGGQIVEKGEKIAEVGSTGNATSSCLHFELKVSGICVNPEYYI